MGVSQKHKGARGEIQVAKDLATWWAQVEQGCKFKRTPLSGGWGDADTRGGFKVAGDICTTAERWPFTVEVKRREGWSFGTFARGRLSPVWGWWRQCIEQAAEEDRIPMLWFRKNRQPWLVLLPERLLVPILVRHQVQPDLVLRVLSPGVDDGDIRPAMVLGSKLLALPPTAWLPGRRRKGAPGSGV